MCRIESYRNTNVIMNADCQPYMDKACLPIRIPIFAQKSKIMKKTSRNPYSGRNSSGFRFRFHIPSISRLPLFLPIEMKELPQIKILLEGGSPLEAFGVDSLDTARRFFRSIRKRYDFDYWAIKEFFVRDINDPDRIIPLHLNDRQSFAIDIIRRRYFLRRHGRYIISKSGSRCGITTCIQAFILWLQTCVHSKNVYTCTHNDLNAIQLRDNLFRFLERRGSPYEKRIFIHMADNSFFFNTFRNPDAMRGIDFGYVHLADMSKWKDSASRTTGRAYVAGISGVLPDYSSIIVLEGNIPRPPYFSIQKEINVRPRCDEKIRKMRFRSVCRNPFFLNSVVVANDYPDPYLYHIDLDKAGTPSISEGRRFL